MLTCSFQTGVKTTKYRATDGCNKTRKNNKQNGGRWFSKFSKSLQREREHFGSYECWERLVGGGTYIPRLESITRSMAVLVASTITPATERKVSSSPTTDQWPLWKAKAPSPPPPYHHGEDKQRTRASPPHKVFLLLVFNHIFFLSILRLLFSESFI